MRAIVQIVQTISYYFCVFETNKNDNNALKNYNSGLLIGIQICILMVWRLYYTKLNDVTVVSIEI